MMSLDYIKEFLGVTDGFWASAIVDQFSPSDIQNHTCIAFKSVYSDEVMPE